MEVKDSRCTRDKSHQLHSRTNKRHHHHSVSRPTSITCVYWVRLLAKDEPQSLLDWLLSVIPQACAADCIMICTQHLCRQRLERFHRFACDPSASIASQALPAVSLVLLLHLTPRPSLPLSSLPFERSPKPSKADRWYIAQCIRGRRRHPHPDSTSFKHATDWQQVLLHRVSHYEFGVDLLSIENHVLIVLLMSAMSNTVLRKNRVKRPTRRGCIVGRSSLLSVCRGSAVR